MSDGNKGNGNNVGDGNGNSDEAGGQQKRQGRAVRAMATAMCGWWVMKGEGSKAMLMAMETRMAGKWSAMGTKRLMATVTRVAGK